MALKKARS